MSYLLKLIMRKAAKSSVLNLKAFNLHKLYARKDHTHSLNHYKKFNTHQYELFALSLYYLHE